MAWLLVTFAYFVENNVGIEKATIIHQENGGCGFFQWCDAAVQSSGTQQGTQSYGSTNESKFPDHQCPCSAGLCRVLTAKTGENVGRQFYRCPVFEVSKNVMCTSVILSYKL